MAKLNIKNILKKNKTITNIYNIYRAKSCLNAYKKSPEEAIKKLYYKRTGLTLNLDNPQTFNEKIQWLKLYWYDPIVHICADKYAVREYLENKGYGNLLNTVYGVYTDVKQINYAELPNQFVLKAVHGSGWNIFCKDKNSLNNELVNQQLQLWLHSTYGSNAYEWYMSEIPPRIICEKFIHTADQKPPTDYKFICFDGVPYVVQVSTDRFDKHVNNDFFTCDWEHLDVYNVGDHSQSPPPRPKHFDEMLDLCKELSKGFPLVRIDLYDEEDKVIFGEFTFFCKDRKSVV